MRIEAALDPPQSLGEARHLLASTADLQLLRGDALDALDRTDEAVQAWQLAAIHSGDWLVKLLLVSTVGQVRASAVDIHQRVMRGDELLVEGRITAAFLDGSGRPIRHPKDWVMKFERFVNE